MHVRRAVGAGILMAVLGAGSAQAATSREESVATRLQDRREVAAGTRAYAVGFEDGRFYANGWHITGEMGGVWTPPLKLVDGVWFGVDGQWVGPATRFTSGWGYTRYELPAQSGLTLRRTDFVPDGRRGALFGLELRNPGRRARHADVAVDAHSELMSAYPWGFDGVTPNASDNIPDTAAFNGRALVFRDQGALPGAPRHDYTALVASSHRPRSGETGPGFRGPQPGTVCTGKETPAKMPSECDDGPFGRGKGGELHYNVTIPPRQARTVWVAVAGSDRSPGAARAELRALLRRPERALAAKVAARRALAARSQVSLPGDPLLEKAIDWGKQNLADLTQQAQDLKIRWTNQGKQFPPPSGTVPRATWIGAGFPDYPWIFATDAEYTAFANVALGQFASIEGHLRTLRDISVKLNPNSGVVVHEAVSDGSIWFGKDTSTVDPATGERKYDFNTDETVKFPSALALVWRWTGDNALRDDLYPFAVRNLKWVDANLDTDHDGWLEGSGNVERTGMGQEKLDNTVYYLRGLYDLADLAASKGDAATRRWALARARNLRSRFEGAWWMPEVQQYADSLRDPGDVKDQQKHWIGVTPMDAELNVGGRAVPGIAQYDRAQSALTARETSCYSGERPGNRGLFHTGCGGGADQKGDPSIFSLTTSIQAIGEGNYGRLGAGQQRRYTDANAETMFSEPATGGTPDEQPGAMPEIFPSFKPDGTVGNPPNIDRCFTCRSMFMQAWGNYGTAWSVMHQQLGVRPDLGRGRVEVVPQVPDGQRRVQGTNIRLGRGSIDVLASRAGARYTTTIDASDTPARSVRIGHTLPRGARVARVALDGRAVARVRQRTTNRGLEVTVRVSRGRHTLVVTAA